MLVHDIYSSNPHAPSFVATPDGQWLTVEAWVESQRRQLPSAPRTPAEIYRTAAAKSGPDVLTRAGFDSLLDDTDMWEMMFEEAVERFDARIAEDVQLVDEDVETALAVQAGTIVDTPDGSLPDLSDPIFHALLVAGRAGYVWRTVEHEQPKGFGFVGDELEEVYRSVVVLGGDRTATLSIAAERALEQGITFQWESPGGMLKGPDFLEAGYDYVMSDSLAYDGGDLAGEQALRRMFFVGVLIRDMEKFAGPAPAAADTTDEAPTEQRLGRELFDRDRDAYIRLAGWIVSDAARPQLPQPLQGISTRAIFSMLRLFDPDVRGTDMTPLAAALALFCVEISTGAYTLAAREEWEGFDAPAFRGLVDELLDAKGRSANSEENLARVVLGVSTQHDDYAGLASYLDEQAANIRLGEFADTFAVRPGDALVQLMEQDESVKEKVGWTSTIGWTAGVMLALLERAALVNEEAVA